MPARARTRRHSEPAARFVIPRSEATRNLGWGRRPHAATHTTTNCNGHMAGLKPCSYDVLSLPQLESWGIQRPYAARRVESSTVFMLRYGPTTQKRRLH